MEMVDLEKYGYPLPPGLIAQKPAVPRDKARLLVYNRATGQTDESDYLKLPLFLPPKTALVFNDTKVIPARIESRRPTGGKCEILFIGPVGPEKYQAFLSRGIPLGEELVLKGGLRVKVSRQREQFFHLNCPLPFPDLIRYLEKYGNMPVPPYIKHPDKRNKLKTEYQTVFARKYGSVAAPTASLHFTRRLMKKLENDGVRLFYVTLHVGLGTFLPLTDENLKTGALHEEYFEVSQPVWQRINASRQEGYRIVPVGTTSMRTIESVARTGQLSGQTSLFIRPGFKFRLSDGLITNFHLPKTSLMLLVASFIGDRKKTMDLYRLAVRNGFRFYSFGDGMLIL